MAGRFSFPTPVGFDASGNPGAGDKLYFYESDTSTLLDTYSDDDLTTPNANPVVADSAGRWGDIFLKGQDYKVIWKDSDDVTIKTWDPVRAAEPTSTATRSISTTETQVASDNGKLILADATSGAFTYTLLPAATAGDGFEVNGIKIDSSANAVTIDADGSETINGDTSIDLTLQFDSFKIRSNGSAWYAINLPASTATPLPANYITGLSATINSTDSDHDIDIAAGSARDGADAANLVVASSLTKRIDAAWAVGSGGGGLDTGTVANSTVYHLWLIRRSDTGVTDALFSTSSSSPTMPSGYDQRRYLTQLITDGSANIDKIYVREDESPGMVDAVSLSGESVDINGIPSWVRKITIDFSALSTSGTSNVILQIGDSGGIENTGYSGSLAQAVDASATAGVNFSDGFRLTAGIAAAQVASGKITLGLSDSANNTWVAEISCGINSTAASRSGSGYKSLSATLDRLRLTMQNGTDTFDAGSMSVRYEA